MANDETKRLEIDLERGDHESPFEKWMVEIEARAKDTDLSSPAEQLCRPTTSVYKVPALLRECNPKAFTPELVSFGPLHHGNLELKPMEVHKVTALVAFIKRANHPPLQNIVGEVYKIITKLRDAYSFLDDMWKTDDEAFLKMMIVDGCFMLQIIYSFYNHRKRRHPYGDDLFLNLHGAIHKLPYIRRDMLLIENQLPLFLLEALVPFLHQNSELVAKDIENIINTRVLRFVTENWIIERTTLQGLHVLDIFRESLLSPNFHQHKPTLPILLFPTVIRCAVELLEAGVRFRKSKTKDLRDISFNYKTGEFHLPFLVVDGALLNMIAFEHLHGGEDQYVTAYVCLLDEIINSASDVSLLHREGIILNKLGSDEKVAALFNSIAKEATMYPNRLLREKKAIFQYCQENRHRWKTNLINTYFKSPWSAISLAGALLAILLTIIQTVYSVLGK